MLSFFNTANHNNLAQSLHPAQTEPETNMRTSLQASWKIRLTFYARTVVRLTTCMHIYMQDYFKYAGKKLSSNLPL